MDFNSVDVGVWSCKAVWKARSAEELRCVRNLRISAKKVRELWIDWLIKEWAIERQKNGLLIIKEKTSGPKKEEVEQVPSEEENRRYEVIEWEKKYLQIKKISLSQEEKEIAVKLRSVYKEKFGKMVGPRYLFNLEYLREKIAE